MASTELELQHLIYSRTLKGDRRVDVTEHAAERSKDGTKAKIETKWKCEGADTLYFNNF